MKKILIVEDDKNILLALSIRLKSAGYASISAPDAACGTKRALQENPDLIILDVGMPGGDGFDVAERIRRHPDSAITPIIFLTANNNPRFIEKAKEYDAVGFFHKPYDSDRLMSSIDRAIG